VPYTRKIQARGVRIVKEVRIWYKAALRWDAEKGEMEAIGICEEENEYAMEGWEKERGMRTSG
jgi:hypothetical protein